MQITVRTLLASVAASAVLGGVVGALATAATTSQASPQAIATAVQQVSDQTTQRELRAIESNQHALQATSEEIHKNTYNICWDASKGSRQQVDCAGR
jgi:hypothetical protein